MAGVQENALRKSLAARGQVSRPEDAAAEALARRLAQLIDAARQPATEAGDDAEPGGAAKRVAAEALVVTKLAAEYRQALVQLGITPAARAALAARPGGTVAAAPPASPLQEQRDRLAQQRAKRAGL